MGLHKLRILLAQLRLIKPIAAFERNTQSPAKKRMRSFTTPTRSRGAGEWEERPGARRPVALALKWIRGQRSKSFQHLLPIFVAGPQAGQQKGLARQQLMRHSDQCCIRPDLEKHTAP